MLYSRTAEKTFQNMENYRTFDADEKNKTMWTDTPLNKIEKLGVGLDLDRYQNGKSDPDRYHNDAEPQ
jgi:hypothetical protein